jgi:GST-like protein
MRPIPFDLYGARTGNCIRAAIAFEEAMLPYTVKKLDLPAGEHRTEPFVTLNPVGKVPVIVDHGGGDEQPPIIITQSNAILFHVADQVPGVLLPQRYSSVRHAALENFFYFLTDVIAPSHASFALRTDSNAIAARRVLDERALDSIVAAERFAHKHEFLNGERFGLADIAAVTIMNNYRSEIPWHIIPALRRWYDSAIGRPSVVRGMHAFDA